MALAPMAAYESTKSAPASCSARSRSEKRALAVQRCPADDLGVGAETTAVDGQVDVGVVVVGGDDDRRCLGDAGLLQDRELGGVADDVLVRVAHSLGELLDDHVVKAQLEQGLGG